jgi:membrane protein YdbS with pleckstrin-like domain
MQETVNFTNDSVSEAELPQLSHLTFQLLSPAYAKANRYIDLFTTLLLVSVLFIIQLQSFYPLSQEVSNIFRYIIWTVAFIGAVSFTYTVLADKRKFYALREQDLSYKSGVVFRKTVSQPMLRIQHVELKRGPIDRKVGLAKLQVFSAGGALHTFEIPGLPLETAETIRQFILDHKDVNHHG